MHYHPEVAAVADLLVVGEGEHYLAVEEHNPVRVITRNVSSQTPDDTDR